MTLDMKALEPHIRGELENYRSVRYVSEEQAVALHSFASDDRTTIRKLYDFLAALDRLLREEVGTQGLDALVAFIGLHDVSALVFEARGLGRTAADDRLSAALHDIRGGALTALFIQLTRVVRLPTRHDLARGIAMATRDHMKIMRNLIVDIDPHARERDLALVPHSLGELATALGAFTASIGDQQIATVVNCEQEATIIAETCVECAAVDRVAYNLLNNAAAHTTRPAIDVRLAPRDGNLLVAVANGVSAEHEALVQRTMAEDPSAFFGSFTTTRSGHGLRIASELVARAYGVTSIERLIADGYVGAKLIESAFVSWFHWPLSQSQRGPHAPSP